MRRDIRILVWCPLVNAGGGERLLRQLVLALGRQSGVELVRLAVPEGSYRSIGSAAGPALEVFPLTASRPAGPLRSWLREDRRVLGIKGTGRLKKLLRASIPRAEEGQDWLREQLRIASRDCDVVYVFWPHRQDFPQLDMPVVCTFQDATFFDFPEILGGAETRAEFQRSSAWLSGCSQVVVSSAATKGILMRHFGESCSSVVVIGHAIVPEMTREARPLLPALHALPDGYIVCPANINPHKNHYNLLLAWSRLSESAAPHLVLFGPGTELLGDHSDPFSAVPWYACRLRGLVVRTGLRVGRDYSALGFVEDSDVLPIISRAAALVMPTLAEGGGSFPVEEALSLGVPVLCSDIPVLREQLAARTAKVGWFDPESPESIVAAVQDLVENYPAYKQAALRASNDARPTWDDVAAQYVALFRDVVARADQSREH